MKLATTGLLPLLLVLSLSRGALAAGNEEDVLIENMGTTPHDSEERISYQCTYRNLWTEGRQPVNFPQETARVDGPILWTHTLQFEPWKAGFAVTRGVEKMAEDGFADVLIQEMEQQGSQVLAWSENPELGFFVEEADFVHLPPIEASQQFPFFSMMAGMSPSPDWFTGFYSYWLIDEYTRTWYDHLKIQVKPWKAGTDAGATYDSLNMDLDPPIVTERFVPRNAPEGGELLSPSGDTVPNVGEIECFLVVGDEDLVLPECDWFANPCCNETDTVGCGSSLPNGADPLLSAEYMEVLSVSEELSEAIGATNATATNLDRLAAIAEQMRQLAAEVDTLIQELRADETEEEPEGATVATSKKNDDL